MEIITPSCVDIPCKTGEWKQYEHEIGQILCCESTKLKVELKITFVQRISRHTIQLPVSFTSKWKNLNCKWRLKNRKVNIFNSFELKRRGRKSFWHTNCLFYFSSAAGSTWNSTLLVVHCGKKKIQWLQFCWLTNIPINIWIYSAI